jgi:hypothetical protein
MVTFVINSYLCVFFVHVHVSDVDYFDHVIVVPGGPGLRNLRSATPRGCHTGGSLAVHIS